jgi:ubiquinone/menaquinone biosynthesis C-methylase UbiE
MTSTTMPVNSLGGMVLDIFPDVETSSDDYAQRFSGQIGKWFLLVQEYATLKMLAPHPKATILDVGGGHGQMTPALVTNGYPVTVFGSAESCKKRVQPLIDAGQCKFEVGNIFTLPYADRAFDVVISYRLLSHVEHWQRLLAELTRVARKAVIIDYPDVKSINYLAPYLFTLKKGIEGSTRTYRCFDAAEIRDEFSSLGFAEVTRFSQFFLPMVLHRKLKSLHFSTSAERICRALGLTSRWGSPVLLKMSRKYGKWS